MKVDLRRLILVFIIAVGDLTYGQVIDPSEPSAHNPNEGQENSGGGGCDTQTSNVDRPFTLGSLANAASTNSFSGSGRALEQSFSDECSDINQDYRTIDGSCNHERNLGAAFTTVARLLPPEYDDGVSEPRAKGVSGNALPSARAVSTIAHPGTSNPDESLTHMVMQWGQFVDHDITAFPVATEFDESILCCGENGAAAESETDESCFPIDLPEDETNFPGVCMEFVRSISATDSCGDELNPREQINSLTSFVDGSMIYSAEEEAHEELRDEESRHKLKTVNDNFLPDSESEECILDDTDPEDYCFLAGDSRVNEQPYLASMQTLFMREHNRIADELKSLLPDYTEDQIFNIARKIVGAIIQKITYNDWLPIILGDTGMSNYDLDSSSGRSSYNSAIDPRISNAFATAAMRFGHTLIPEWFVIGDTKTQLRELFNRPKKARDYFDDVLSGLAGVETLAERVSESFDENFVEDVTEYLFIPEGGALNSGLDLVSLNIQRGRDHGIPPYVKYRELCGLALPSDFDDTEVLGDGGSRLKEVYESVDDIDLFTGLMHEPQQDGFGIVGPTTNCLLGTQFASLKFGDQFFFDTDNEQVGFDDDQLASIRKYTLSKVICANTNNEQLPQDAFRTVDGSTNSLTKCSELLEDTLDLSLWT